MNRSPATLLLIALAGLGAMYVASSVLMGSNHSGSNPLADAFYYIMFGLGALGILAPRLAFFIFLFECGYLDLFKRLLVFGGHVGMEDLFWVLGAAPVTIVGVTLGLLLRLSFGTIPGGRQDWHRFFFTATGIGGYAVLIFLQGGGIGGTLRETANGSSYALLLFVVPLLFPRQEDLISMVKVVLWLFLPVAAYALYQQVFGWADYEVDYLRRGLSIEMKLLEVNRIRSFSTLNSSTSVSVVMASCAAFALALMKLHRSKHQLLGISPPAALAAIALFIAAWAASTVRVGILLLPVAYLGTKAFLYAYRTRAFYGSLAFGYGLLILSADWILGQLFVFTEWAQSSFAKGNTYLENVLNIQTYSDRVKGFSNVIMNPRAYSFFGKGSDALSDPSFFAHDPVSTFLLVFGIVPLIGAILFGFFFVRRIHRIIWVIQDPTTRYLAAAFLANSAGNFVVTLVNGNLLISFPVNVFFWLGIAGTLALRKHWEATKQPPPTREASRSPAPAPARPKLGRFAPVPRTAKV
jgi:hypothetical protein